MDATFEIVKKLKEQIRQSNPFGDMLVVNEILTDKPTIGKYFIRFSIPEPNNGGWAWKTKLAIADKSTLTIENIKDAD